MHPLRFALALLALLTFFSCRTHPTPSASPTTPIAPTAPPAAANSAPFDIGAVMRTVHFAFRPEGASWRGGHSTYEVTADATHFSTVIHSAEDTNSAPISFVTARLDRSGTSRRANPPSVRVASDGSLVVDRGVAEENLRNTERGLEQSWTFASRPEGNGDLEIAVDVQGADFLAMTSTGAHFTDPTTGLGVAYGNATWIDARGTHVAVPVERSARGISLRVPATVVDAAAYPVTLDPYISPEIGTDDPIIGPAYDDQQTPDVARGVDSWLVVWADSRILGSRLFGARVDSSGVLLDPFGIVLATSTGTQPTVAFNGTDWLVVWRAPIATDLRATRVSTAGAVLDPATIAVDPTSGVAHDNPSVAAAGSTWLVTWAQSTDIFGQRIAATGARIDATPIPISTVTGTQQKPRVASNGTQWFVVWTDGRGGSSTDVFGAIVDAAGGVAEPLGFAISVRAGNQGSPDVAFDGTNWLVAWGDGSGDVYGARLDPAGTLLDPTGFVISNATGTQQVPAISVIGGQAMVVWVDGRSGTGNDIYGARVTSAGTVLDPTGIALIAATGSQNAPRIANDGTQFLTVWQDLRSPLPSTDVRVARISTTGTVSETDGLLVTRAPNRQNAAAVASDGTNWLLLWSDYRRGTEWDIWGTRIGPTGTVLDPSGLPIAVTPGDQIEPAVAYNGSEFMAVWNSASDIYGRRIARAGTPVSAEFAVNASTSVAQTEPAIATNGTNWLVVWTHSTDIRATRVSFAGAVLDPTTLTITSAANDQRGPAIAANGAAYLVTWSDYRADGSYGDVYGARVQTTGIVSDASGIPIAITAGSSQVDPSVTSDGTNWYVAWADHRRGSSQPQIFGSRMSPAGVLLEPSGLLISTAMSSRIGQRPSVTYDGIDYFVAWQYTNIGRAIEVHGARVSTAGLLLDSPEIVIETAASDVLAPAVARGARRNILVSYERLDASLTSRVYSRIVSFDVTDGSLCSSAAGCSSGFCVDGVCCASACGGGDPTDCQACSVSAGAAVDGVCGAVTAGRTCRGSTGLCDAVEVCDGTSPSCPPDALSTAGTVCRAAVSPCDVAEVCNGTATACPADAVAGAGVVCRASVSNCDVEESCNGVAPTCPTDGVVPGGTVCRPAISSCDVSEACTGSSNQCPVDLVAPAGTTCRMAVSACDVAETCDGAAATCPSDVFASATVVCRSSSGACDTAEQCTGFSSSCPADQPAPDGTSCADGVVCNGAETCSAGACMAGGSLGCDDGDACTSDSCAEPTGCRHDPIAGCCRSAIECDDGDACTSDMCLANSCLHAPITGCGVVDAGTDADDADAADDGTTPDAGGEDVFDAAMPDAGGEDVFEVDASAIDASDATDTGDDANDESATNDVSDVSDVSDAMLGSDTEVVDSMVPVDAVADSSSATDVATDSGATDAASGADAADAPNLADATGSEPTTMNRGCACAVPGRGASDDFAPWKLVAAAIAIAIASGRRRKRYG